LTLGPTFGSSVPSELRTPTTIYNIFSFGRGPDVLTVDGTDISPSAAPMEQTELVVLSENNMKPFLSTNVTTQVTDVDHRTTKLDSPEKPESDVLEDSYPYTDGDSVLDEGIFDSTASGMGGLLLMLVGCTVVCAVIL
jgi:hypothetical protein